MSLENNKIFASVLTAGILLMASGFAAKSLYHPKDLEENAFKIEVSDSGVEVASAGAEEPSIEPISALLATADVAAGESGFKKCASCHTIESGGSNKVGPALWDIVGRGRAAVDGFSYSDALQGMSSEAWDYEALNEFLAKPKDYAPGTKMGFAGLKKVEDRANLIAYMRMQSDSPAALPQ
ncbi:cytochrome c family protein [Kiloniella laminariae]|uniref:Cytochrome c family protein n=1 Tax=Kiloniella laminariae TaxID=454162 RepID=A0ABT4LKU3_9PROT|nr:cytochrome c family protein [Kiloniella laminariae]MCZ4281580.1 cytochrome c family protein [Kiloniella laminariae]